jgi:hypothetical protein
MKKIKGTEVLWVSIEAIKNYSDEALFNIIDTYHNTSSDNSTLIASSMNYQPTFTVEKLLNYTNVCLPKKIGWVFEKLLTAK